MDHTRAGRMLMGPRGLQVTSGHPQHARISMCWIMRESLTGPIWRPTLCTRWRRSISEAAVFHLRVTVDLLENTREIYKHTHVVGSLRKSTGINTLHARLNRVLLVHVDMLVMWNTVNSHFAKNNTRLKEVRHWRRELPSPAETPGAMETGSGPSEVVADGFKPYTTHSAQVVSVRLQSDERRFVWSHSRPRAARGARGLCLWV